MSLTENDPLRFLKPRKKNFHLTPTKNSIKIGDNSKSNIQKLSSGTQYIFNKSQNQGLNNQNAIEQSDQNFLHKSRQPQTNQTHQKFKEKWNCRDSKAQYNPLKYFSQKVQELLTKKPNQPQIKEEGIRKTEYYWKAPIDDQSYRNDSIEIQTEINTKSNHINLHPSNTYKKFSNQSSAFVKIPEKLQIKQIIPESKQSNAQVREKNTIKQTNQLSLYKNQGRTQAEEQEEQSDSQGQGLKKCQICSRSFNPTSYDKHVKVCEKVFFKKRKEFSSQKQRSLSKKK